MFAPHYTISGNFVVTTSRSVQNHERARSSLSRPFVVHPPTGPPPKPDQVYPPRSLSSFIIDQTWQGWYIQSVTSTTISKNNIPIRLPAERWAHILEEHGELNDMRSQILDAVANPLRILAGQAGEQLAIQEI